MAGFAKALTVLRAISHGVHAGATMTDPNDAECIRRIIFSRPGEISVVGRQSYDKAKDKRGLSSTVSHIPEAGHGIHPTKDGDPSLAWRRSLIFPTHWPHFQ